MLELPLVAVYGALCAGALVASAHAPVGQRRECTLMAIAVLANWELYVLSYTPYSLAVLFAGAHPDDVFAWAIADVICGCAAILLAFDRWWGWALWGLSVIQLAMHAGEKLHLFGDVFYTDRLDNLLLAQLAIFFLVGGGGVWNRITDISRRASRAIGSHRAEAAPRETARPGSKRISP